MSEEQLAFYEMVIKADKTHDVNFKNVARELFIEVKELQQKIDKAIEYINKHYNIKAYYEYIDEDGYDEYRDNEDFKVELLEILGDKENVNK